MYIYFSCALYIFTFIYFSLQWRVGDRCRAVFTEDGEIYDAVILSIDKQKDTCFVRYVGYGNEEKQYLPNLMPSEDSIKTQSTTNDVNSQKARGDRGRPRDTDSITEVSVPIESTGLDCNLNC